MQLSREETLRRLALRHKIGWALVIAMLIAALLTKLGVHA